MHSRVGSLVFLSSTTGIEFCMGGTMDSLRKRTQNVCNLWHSHMDIHLNMLELKEGTHIGAEASLWKLLH